MISTITGNNQLEMRQQLDQRVNHFIQEFSELALEKIDGPETELTAILETVQSLPFLAAKKLVVFRSLSQNKEASTAIEQIISSIIPEVDVIFYEPNPDKRASVYKLLKAQTTFNEYAEIEPRELPKWLVQYAKEQGGSLSLADAQYLIERVGINQQLLASELDKLITYEPQLNRETINLLTEKSSQAKVFDLLDAAFAGQAQKALKLYDEQRAQRVEPQEILAMLAWQLRLIAFAKLGQTRSPDAIAADIGGSSYPISKAQGLAAKLTPQKLSKMVAEAERIDRLNKTKTVDLDEALKAYITTVL